MELKVFWLYGGSDMAIKSVREQLDELSKEYDVISHKTTNCRDYLFLSIEVIKKK